MSLPLKGVLETILVVDDNDSVLKIVVAILEGEDFRVLSAVLNHQIDGFRVIQ